MSWRTASGTSADNSADRMAGTARPCSPAPTAGGRAGLGSTTGAADDQVAIERRLVVAVGEGVVVERVVALAEGLQRGTGLELEAQQHHGEPVRQVAGPDGGDLGAGVDHGGDGGLEIGQAVAPMLLELGLIGTERDEGVAPHQLLDPGHPGGVERRGDDHQIAAARPSSETNAGPTRGSHVLEHVAAHHGVELVVREGQAGSVGQGHRRARQPQRLELHVHADHVELGVEGVQVPGGVAHVEHPMRARTQRGPHGAHDGGVAGVAVERRPGHVRVGEAGHLGSEALAHGWGSRSVVPGVVPGVEPGIVPGSCRADAA